MPTQNRDGGANARMFKENFLAAGGLRYDVLSNGSPVTIYAPR